MALGKVYSDARYAGFFRTSITRGAESLSSCAASLGAEIENSDGFVVSMIYPFKVTAIGRDTVLELIRARYRGAFAPICKRNTKSSNDYLESKKTEVPARRFGTNRTMRPSCMPKLSCTFSPLCKASSRKSACVPTRILGVSYHW